MHICGRDRARIRPPSQRDTARRSGGFSHSRCPTPTLPSSWPTRLEWNQLDLPAVTAQPSATTAARSVPARTSTIHQRIQLHVIAARLPATAARFPRPRAAAAKRHGQPYTCLHLATHWSWNDEAHAAPDVLIWRSLRCGRWIEGVWQIQCAILPGSERLDGLSIVFAPVDA